MSEQKPRSPPTPAQSGEQDRGVAAAALLTGCAVLTLLMLGIGGDSVQTGQRPTVTVQDVPAGAARRNSEAPVGSADFGETAGRRLAEGLVLAPRVIEGRIAGYVIGSESDAASLSQAKLRAGDMLIDLDGRPIDPARIQALGDELSAVDSVEVSFVRDGQVRKRAVDLNR